MDEMTRFRKVFSKVVKLSNRIARMNIRRWYIGDKEWMVEQIAKRKLPCEDYPSIDKLVEVKKL